MGRLLLVTRPHLLSGYQLAGVQAVAARDAGEAAAHIGQWLDEGASGLLAIDELLFASLDDGLRLRMDQAEELPYLALPSGEPAAATLSAQHFVAEMIRRTIGFQLTFSGDE